MDEKNQIKINNIYILNIIIIIVVVVIIITTKWTKWALQANLIKKRREKERTKRNENEEFWYLLAIPRCSRDSIHINIYSS